MGDASAMAPVELRTALESGGWTLRQKMFVVIIALAIVVDGFDNQGIGLTIPAIVADWRVARAAFAPVLALGIIGLSLGTMSAGWLGDRYGRRLWLIVSLTLFGVMTAITTTTGSIHQ